MIQRNWAQRVAYPVTRLVCWVLAVVLYRFRCKGRQQVPKTGGGLVLSNHQSFFDPLILGIACDRRLNFVARETLFRTAGFAGLIRFFDAIPIQREGLGIGGLKETLRRLKYGEFVLLFPEGTRTKDGEVAPIKPGFCALARRGKVPLIPAAIDGAYQAWPSDRRLPSLGVIHVCLGPPIGVDEIGQYTDSQLVAEVARRIRDCHAVARRGRAKLGGLQPRT